MLYDKYRIKRSETAKNFLKALEDVAYMSRDAQMNLAMATTKLHPSFHYAIVRMLKFILICESEDYKTNSPYNENKETALEYCNTIVETILRTDEKERANTNAHTGMKYLLRDVREREKELERIYKY